MTARPTGATTGPIGGAVDTPSPAAVDDTRALAAAVRTAVLAVPGVVRLAPDAGGVEVATQFAGGKIPGIRLGEVVAVHVDVAAVPIGPLAEQVRTAVRDVLGASGRCPPVEVVVHDIDLPEPSRGG